MAMRDQFVVRAPIEFVFDSLVDPRWLEAALRPRGVTIELVTPEPVGLGTRIRMVGGVRGPWVWELTEFERPTHLAGTFTWTERRGVGRTVYDLAPTGHGTSVSMEGRGFFGPVGWAMLALWPPAQARIHKGNRELANAIEQRLASVR